MCSSNVLLEVACNVLSVKHELNHCIYRVIQEGRSVFWKVMVSVIVRKTLIWTCVWFWIVTTIQLFECTDSEALWMVIKEKKIVTVYNACSKTHRQLQCNSCVGWWRFVRPSWSSSFFMRATTLKMRAVLLVYPPLFRQLHFLSNLTNIRVKGGNNIASKTQTALSR